ncbi:hypothetical protein Q5P01_002807 [Channa striata]|uniref:Uncharacterized protein n=1 Tax=Channa striata TaxID=64152 RepID=A0AA88NUY2_CHASR|nr:hypothetical protein Q5P01_002807 [Channa striata]
MTRSDTAEDNRLMSTGTNEHRNPQLASCFSTAWASVISTFCTGLVSGAAGGLLLGATAVVIIQSLELLDKNKLHVDQLLNFMTVKGVEQLKSLLVLQV